MSKRRVVVTGMGIVSPVGNDIATAWSNVVEGRSGIGPVTHFDASGYATRIAGEVRDFDASAWVPPKDVKRMDPFIHYGIAAGLQAFRDSGFTITEQNAEPQLACMRQPQRAQPVHRAHALFVSAALRELARAEAGGTGQVGHAQRFVPAGAGPVGEHRPVDATAA